MHDATCEGNDFFKCDFCLRGWTEDVPMVEGHRGSLICANCLRIACLELKSGASVVGPDDAKECRLCLQSNVVPHWLSPIEPPEHLSLENPAAICEQCAKRCSGMLEKDPDVEWTAPV